MCLGCVWVCGERESLRNVNAQRVKPRWPRARAAGVCACAHITWPRGMGRVSSEASARFRRPNANNAQSARPRGNPSRLEWVQPPSSANRGQNAVTLSGPWAGERAAIRPNCLRPPPQASPLLFAVLHRLILLLRHKNTKRQTLTRCHHHLDHPTTRRAVLPYLSIEQGGWSDGGRPDRWVDGCCLDPHRDPTHTPGDILMVTPSNQPTTPTPSRWRRLDGRGAARDNGHGFHTALHRGGDVSFNRDRRVWGWDTVGEAGRAYCCAIFD